MTHEVKSGPYPQITLWEGHPSLTPPEPVVVAPPVPKWTREERIGIVYETLDLLFHEFKDGICAEMIAERIGNGMTPTHVFNTLVTLRKRGYVVAEKCNAGFYKYRPSRQRVPWWKEFIRRIVG